MLTFSISIIHASHAYNNMPALVVSIKNHSYRNSKLRYHLVIHPFSQIRIYRNMYDVYDTVSEGKESIL